MRVKSEFTRIPHSSEGMTKLEDRVRDVWEIKAAGGGPQARFRGQRDGDQTEQETIQCATKIIIAQEADSN